MKKTVLILKPNRHMTIIITFNYYYYYFSQDAIIGFTFSYNSSVRWPELTDSEEPWISHQFYSYTLLTDKHLALNGRGGAASRELHKKGVFPPLIPEIFHKILGGGENWKTLTAHNSFLLPVLDSMKRQGL